MPVKITYDPVEPSEELSLNTLYGRQKRKEGEISAMRFLQAKGAKWEKDYTRELSEINEAIERRKE